MPLAITSFYAGILALLFVALSFRVIAMRRSAGVGIGDGGNNVLLRRQRAHGNFAEYVPFCLLLMGLVEAQGASAMAVHTTGLLLLAGRLAHAVALNSPQGVPLLRVGGMVLTFAALISAAALNLRLASGLFV